MISFVVPAHNEQACLPRTLQAIHDSARIIGKPYEIIVVDDASTDATPEIARQHQARVVSVNHRQIAATRNSGARAALGEWIFFVDADTTCNPQAVASALRYMEQGAVGGGAPTWLGPEEKVPLFVRLLLFGVCCANKLTGFTGGAFMFCTRDAFLATGGFNERLYWSEEGAFALALKREGRFVVLWKPVLTSGRRVRKVSGLKILAGILRFITAPVKFFTQRSAVAHIWYDSNRSHDDIMPQTLSARISNAFLLLIAIIFAGDPLWALIPWSWTPRATWLGKFRLSVDTILCHVGLIFWPIALILLVNLLRQKRLTSLFQSAALIIFLSWEGWLCTSWVITVWTRLFHWLI